MVAAVFAIPGDIRLPTGGYAYDREVLARLPAAGVAVTHLALPGSYPDPSPDDLARTGDLVAATPRDAILLIDGLAYGAMPAALIDRFERPVVALVHHPLCLEAGLTPSRVETLRALETDALARARRIIVTSPMTARTLAADFGVPPARMTVAVPGTDPAPRARGSASGGLRLLAVGSVVPRKGYDILVRALEIDVGAHGRDWRLHIVGALDRSQTTVEALRAQIVRSGLAARIELAGPMARTDLDALYDQADIFVLASHYEGYGMVLAEALARGLPIVTTTGGAAAETVPDGAALKVPPGDAGALQQALRRLMDDATLRRQLADAAWSAGQRLPRWSDTAATIANVLKEARA
ncbi:MAG: glycosyltransferase family 4 protein [Hyphomicrobiaceae bacterium]